MALFLGKNKIIGVEVGRNGTPPINIISFSINGFEYHAIEGMTWKEWVYSVLNPEHTSGSNHPYSLLYGDDSYVYSYTEYQLSLIHI